MPVFLRIFLLHTTFALVTACASETRVRSDYDTSVDFEQLRTFNFSSPTESANPDFPERLRLYFSAAIEQQMLDRGYSRSEEPDILINVAEDLKDKTSAPKKAKRTWNLPYSATTACPDSGDYNGQIARSASATGSLPILCRFKAGPIKVEMTAGHPRRPMWTGTLLVRIDANERFAYLMQNIVNDTALLFANSPFADGREPGRLEK